jgi:hypothetical protein
MPKNKLRRTPRVISSDKDISPFLPKTVTETRPVDSAAGSTVLCSLWKSVTG